MEQVNKELFSNIKVNHVFGSYPKMCAELDIKKKGGGGKEAQMKEIDRYIKLSKGKGYRLIVDEIYDVPKPKMGGSGNIYNGLIQLLITDMIVEAKGKTVLMSRSIKRLHYRVSKECQQKRSVK